MILALLSYWRQPIEISRSTDRRQVGLLLPIGVMIRDPAGGGGGDASTLNGQDGAYYLSRVNHTGTQDASTIAGLATVATSGSYNDLSNKPTISTDAQTLNGQNGTYYLDRSNHTGTQAISTIDNLQDALDLKLDAADYNDRFKGLYASFYDLDAAHPTASAGDYAQVDFGIGSDVIVYTWDDSDQQWVAVGSSPIANTDALPEGSSNLYFTTQRVRDTTLTGFTATNSAIISTDNVVQAFGKAQGQINAISGINSDRTLLYTTPTPNKPIANININPIENMSERLFDNNYIFPANSLAIGDYFELECRVYTVRINITGSVNFSLRPFVNSSAVGTAVLNTGASTAGTFTSAVVSFVDVKFKFVVVAVGVSGLLACNGYSLGDSTSVIRMNAPSCASCDTTQPVALNIGFYRTGALIAGEGVYVKSAQLYRINDPS